MNTQQFFKLEWPFTSKRSGEDWFLFKLEQPTSTTITVDKQPVDLFYGQLHTLWNKNKNIGFLISAPTMDHRTHDDILISAPKQTNVEDLNDEAEVFLTTDKFSVFVLDDEVQFIAAKNSAIQQQFT
jgi:hypothetical protein